MHSTARITAGRCGFRCPVCDSSRARRQRRPPERCHNSDRRPRRAGNLAHGSNSSEGIATPPVSGTTPAPPPAIEDFPLASASPPRTPLSWLSDQPYLLLSLTSLFWAGNAIVGRNAAGHIPPVTLSCVRWGIAFLIVLPFAWRHLARDWPAIRGRLGVMIILSICGIGAFNTLPYLSLEFPTALNILLLQSAGAPVVAIWSLGVSGR